MCALIRIENRSACTSYKARNLGSTVIKIEAGNFCASNGARIREN